MVRVSVTVRVRVRVGVRMRKYLIKHNVSLACISVAFCVYEQNEFTELSASLKIKFLLRFIFEASAN